MATEKDKARMRRIALAMEELNRESAARAAQAGPGACVEKTLELSDLVRRSESLRDKPLPPSLPALWRARHPR